MISQKVIIYGASNYGYEVADTINAINKFQKNELFKIAGFIDDKCTGYKNGIPILGNSDWLEQNSISDYYFICAIGNPITKKKIVNLIENIGGKFISLIHPTAIVSDTARIGAGCIIMAGVIISTLADINNHVILNIGCKIGHNTVVGDYCTINPGASISGDIKLGKGVLIGTNCALLEKIEIGDFSVIGAGSLASTNIPEYVTAIGFPARIIRKNNE